MIPLVSPALPAISVRFSGNVLSVACHCKSVILSGLTVSVHLWPMPVVSGISCTIRSKGVTCFYIRNMSYRQLAMIVTNFNPSISQPFGDSVVFVSRSELFSCVVSYEDSISYV